MVNLNAPAIDDRPLTAADVAEARQFGAGNVYMLHRVTVAGRDTCGGACETQNGCDCYAEACAPEGGTHADPVDSALSMRRHRTTRATVGLAVALAVTGCLLHIVWPLVGT